MFRINDNFTKLPASYLFSEVARRVNAYSESHPGADIIRMGIGDVTRPLCQAAVEALHKAVDDEAAGETFHGYGPEQGYSFLAEKIARYDYRERGIEIDTDEIFVSDGAKSDTGNIGDILSTANRVAVTDPVYPVYVDTNVMGGRAGDLGADGRWTEIEYLPCTAENGFVPALPVNNPDVIYLCYPNNPTGTTLTRRQLKAWVDYCREHGALLLFDAAYEAFIREEDVAHSIYEIEGAREVAIEFRSFPRPRALPASVSVTPWCRKSSWGWMRKETRSRLTVSGVAVRPPNSTVQVTLPSAQLKRSIQKRGSVRSKKPLTTISKMPACSAKGSQRPAMRR